MLFYLGKETEFKKENCKEYKTLKGAMTAAAKDESLIVWDENGQIVGSLVDKNNVPEGALQTNLDSSVPIFDENGNSTGTIDAETVAAVTGNKEEQKNDENEAESKQENSEKELGEDSGMQQEESKSIIPQGKMKVTVICDGSLNLRRTADWGNDNICGRATKGQIYYVKEIHTVNGKKIVRTIDDIYLSGESEHVQFEQL